jgi:hypothetical protein
MIHAEAALQECRSIDGLLGELPIAFEIGTTGCVTAAVARTEVLNRELDACVAKALSRAMFEPRAAPEQRLWYVRGRDPVMRVEERLGLPLELTAVRSVCPEQRAAAAALPNRYDLAQVNERMRGAVHRCMKRQGFDDYSLTVAFNVHAATGRIVGAGAAAEPRSPKLDACLARAAANVCFVPFEAARSTEPYYSFRSTFSSGQPEQLVKVASKCGPAKPWGKARSAQEEIDTLVRPTFPAIRRCFTSHGFSMSEPRWVDVEIESVTGGIVGVAADLAPRRPAVDACIAKTLTRVCVQQFRPIGGSSKERSRHAFIVDPGR